MEQRPLRGGGAIKFSVFRYEKKHVKRQVEIFPRLLPLMELQLSPQLLLTTIAV